jgi:hypothetical protein
MGCINCILCPEKGKTDEGEIVLTNQIKRLTNYNSSNKVVPAITENEFIQEKNVE